MTRTISQGTTRRGGITIFATVVASLVMFTEAAFGLAFTLTQIGGTAVNGRGVIGDTVTVAVDFTIDEDELMIGAAPTLWWDQAGGNVINIVSSIEGGSTTLGGMTFNKINSNYLLFDGSDVRNATVRSFPDGDNFSDSQVGTTYMVGLESIYFFNGDESELARVVESGAPGPAVINMGRVTFRLSGLGATTIGLYVDPSGDSSISSLVIGPRGIAYSGDQIIITDLPVSAVGFGAFQVVVVPEPSTALMLGFGLAALAMNRRRHQPARLRGPDELLWGYGG